MIFAVTIANQGVPLHLMVDCCRGAIQPYRLPGQGECLQMMLIESIFYQIPELVLAQLRQSCPQMVICEILGPHLFP